jgi:hypothetical protein
MLVFCLFSSQAVAHQGRSHQNAHDFGRRAENLLPSHKPVRLRLIAPLSFGEFTAGHGSAVVVDARSGVCAARGGAVMLKTSCSRGLLDLRGPPGKQVMIHLPRQALLSPTGRSKGHAVVQDFKLDRGNPVLVPPDGRLTLGFGATLTGLSHGQGERYTGDFQIETTLLE